MSKAIEARIIALFKQVPSFNRYELLNKIRKKYRIPLYDFELHMNRAKGQLDSRSRVDCVPIPDGVRRSEFVPRYKAAKIIIPNVDATTIREYVRSGLLHKYYHEDYPHPLYWTRELKLIKPKRSKQ